MTTTIQIRDWQRFRRDGEQFIKTAVRAHLKRKKGFNHDALYNLTCMGVEKLIMALIMKNGDLAENHTMVDLLIAMENHLGHSAAIAEKMEYLSSFQEICDLETYTTRQPSSNEVDKIVEIGQEIHTYLSSHLYR